MTTPLTAAVAYAELQRLIDARLQEVRSVALASKEKNLVVHTTDVWHHDIGLSVLEAAAKHYGSMPPDAIVDGERPLTLWEKARAIGAPR